MSQFDKDLKVGDIITAYRKGYHVVEKMERRFFTTADIKIFPHRAVGEEYNSLIHYKQLADQYGTRKTGAAIYKCDSCFCDKLTKNFIAYNYNMEIAASESKRNSLLTLIGVI
jgi:nickel-dependent lactate racemase